MTVSKTVYKVVRQVVHGFGDELRSCVMENTDLYTVYEMGKWTTPRLEGSYLYAFETLEDTVRFIGNTDFAGVKVRVLACKAEVVEEKPYIYRKFFYPKGVEAWWRAARGDFSHTIGSKIAPYGTVWCTRIRPYKEVSLWQQFTRSCVRSLKAIQEAGSARR